MISSRRISWRRSALCVMPLKYSLSYFTAICATRLLLLATIWLSHLNMCLNMKVVRSPLQQWCLLCAFSVTVDRKKVQPLCTGARGRYECQLCVCNTHYSLCAQWKALPTQHNTARRKYRNRSVCHHHTTCNRKKKCIDDIKVHQKC